MCKFIKMKKTLTLNFLLLLFFSSNAQSTLQDPMTGKVFNPEKYSGIRGTPLLFDKWISGTVITINGKYENLLLKFDVYSNTLLFNKDEEIYEFSEKVLQFVLKPKEKDSSVYLYFKNGLAGADIKSYQYLQVLAEGKINLYKVHNKIVSEMSEINAGMIKTFTNSTNYYIQINNQVKYLKLNKNDVLELMKDKSDEVKLYMQEQYKNLKKENDLVDTIKYYNSIN